MTRFNEIIKRNVAPTLLFFAPFYLDFTPSGQDSSWTEFEFAIGKGSYADVSRDCEGRVLSVRSVPFTDAGVSIRHNVSALHFGLSGGILPVEPAQEIFSTSGLQWVYDSAGMRCFENADPLVYLTPTAGINAKYFGLHVGYAFPYHNARFYPPGGVPSGSLRIGNRDGVYFRVRLLDEVPLLSGGPGVGNIGFGFNLRKPKSSLWLGLGRVPYDVAMFGVKLDYPLSDNLLFNFNGAYGFGEAPEFGFSAGTKVRF